MPTLAILHYCELLNVHINSIIIVITRDVGEIFKLKSRGDPRCIAPGPRHCALFARHIISTSRDVGDVVSISTS